MTQRNIRPRFESSPCDVDRTPSLKPSHRGCAPEVWTPIIRCPAPFPIELFPSAVEQLVYHPEYNSTLILRSETLSDVRYSESSQGLLENRDRDVVYKQMGVCSFEGYRPVRMIHRRLLPRRPGRDGSVEQTCVLYATITQELAGAQVENIMEQSEGNVPSLLVLTPLLKAGESLPYYHPAVKRLAVKYTHKTQDTDGFHSESETRMLVIEAVLPPSSPSSVLHLPRSPDPNTRLYRTCLALLDAVHRYGWGALTHYRKRVHHDRLIPREEYQDLYLTLRERYKHLVDTWMEATDPIKHVFEDVGIATFLMLLWKVTYEGSVNVPADGAVTDTSWHNWPRPPAGFLDLGCGNGLLTHILVSEGYAGHGIDVRARQSWSHYPDTTKQALHVCALDPTSYVDEKCIITSPAGEIKDEYFKPDIFLIGNHADELTPWVPVLAALHDAAGYLSIPCCAWGFDERFMRTSSVQPGFPLSHLATLLSQGDPIMDGESFIEHLNLGAEGSHKSQYSAYRIWLAQLSLWMGWKVECEVLRIPSTRNWGIVGRERARGEDVKVYKDRAREIITEVIRRGVFKTRTPEGKLGQDH